MTLQDGVGIELITAEGESILIRLAPNYGKKYVTNQQQRIRIIAKRDKVRINLNRYEKERPKIIPEDLDEEK